MYHNNEDIPNPEDDVYLIDVTNRLNNLAPNPHIPSQTTNDVAIDNISEVSSDLPISESSKLSQNKWYRVFMKIFYVFATIIMYILSIVGLAGVYISCLLSFFCLIIVVFIFFISFITAYVMSPIYLSLSGSWFKFIFSLIQVILSSPLVAFFLYFLTNAIRKLGNLLEQFPEFVAQRKVLIRKLKKEIQDIYDLSTTLEHPILNLILICLRNIVRQFAISIIGVVAFFLTFVYDCPLLLGFIIFIPTLVQIVILLLPTYFDFFRILFGLEYKNKKGEIIMECEEKTGISSRFRHWIEKTLIHRLKQIDNSEDGVVKLNQETQTFMTGQGEFSNKIGYSLTYYSKEQIAGLDSLPSKEDKIQKVRDDFVKHMLQVTYANEYIPLYKYGRLIVMDQYRKHIKLILFWVFFVLNLGLVSFDAYRLIESYQTYFLISTMLRFILIPLLSFFHPLISFFSVAKDKVLMVIINIASIVTFFIAILIIACISFNNMYQQETRIKSLDYIPINNSISYINEKMLGHQVCQFDLYDVTALDAFGYALGGYDVLENPNVFENQLKTFFGENYSSHLNYTVHKIADDIPFLIYHDSDINTTIVAFRGFNTGSEIAFMIEMIANQYVIPFFEDLMPLMDTLSDFGLGEQSKIAHRLGKLMLEPKNLFELYIETIIEICKENHIDEEDRVLFTGINIGGAFAKVAGTQLKKYSLSFLNLPISGDFSIDTFGTDENDMSYITNVFVNDAVFALSEPDVATNIGIFSIEYKEPPKWCKSDICHFNLKKESVYPALCEIAGLCGKNSQFDNYCKTVLGKKDVDTIKEFVMDL